MNTIQNNDFSVSVKQVGAELCSFKSLKSGREYIWQADPSIWGSHAPVLFPIIGCLKDGKTEHQGELFQIPKHGFIRHNSNMKLLRQDETSVCFQLQSSAELKKIYPFEFDFQITYTLDDNKLIVSHKIKNTGNGEMYFSLGGHPAFNCPFTADEKYSDYFLEFSNTENAATWQVTPDGLIGDEVIPVINNSDLLELDEHTFDNDALIFKNLKSKKVALKSKNHKSSIEFNFTEFDYLGIWAKPAAPFVCIEPWLGIADSHNTSGKLTEKEGIITLAGNETFEASYSIAVNE